MIPEYCMGFIFLILIKGIFSSVEIALRANAKKLQNEYLDEKNLPRIDKMSLNSDKYIITVNVVKSLVIMAVGAVLFLLVCDFSNKLYIDSLGISKDSFFIIVACVVTIIGIYFMVIFGSIIPKKIATAKRDSVLKAFALPLDIIYVILSPFVKLIQVLGDLIINFMGLKNIKEDITQEKILHMINVGEEIGNIDEDEKEMINNIFEFDDKTAGEIATYRKNIVAISTDWDTEEILKVVLEEKFSRIPVYKDSIDNIIGIVHIKDVMKNLILFGKDNFDIKALMMEPFFVLFSKKTDELFKEMQKNKIHMSVVLDEYGGTIGIVTMEDLIEEVMGNILDEYDDDEVLEIETIDDNSYKISGTASLEEVAHTLKVDMPTNEYETMSGFIIGQLGHIPIEEENLELEYEGYIFYAEKLEGKRINFVKVTKKDISEASQAVEEKGIDL